MCLKGKYCKWWPVGPVFGRAGRQASYQWGGFAVASTDVHLIRQARQASILDFLHRQGETAKPAGKNGEYIYLAGDCKVSFKANFWHIFGAGDLGGLVKGNALDFAMGAFGLLLPDAVAALLDGQAVEQVQSAVYGASKEAVLEKPIEQQLKAPKQQNIHIVDDTSDVLIYLMVKRRLHPDVAAMFIDHGYVQQDRAKNAVFVCKDVDGGPDRYALRGTGEKRFMQSPPESTPFIYSTFDGSSEIKGAYIFESAIDAMSYYEFYEKKLGSVLLVAAHGITNFSKAIAIVQEHWELEDAQICLCADNDRAGVEAVEKLVEKHPGYKCRWPARGKDWNEYLYMLKVQGDDASGEIDMWQRVDGSSQSTKMQRTERI
jgi:hypothetical protein